MKRLAFFPLLVCLLLTACTTNQVETPVGAPYYSEGQMVFPRLTESSILIRWSDLGGPYILERGDYQDIFVTIATLNETSYEDMGLNAEILYKYRVKNTSGVVLASGITSTTSPGQVLTQNVLPAPVDQLESQATRTQTYIRDYLNKLPTWQSYTGYNPGGDYQGAGSAAYKYWDTKYKQFVGSPVAARCAQEDYYNPYNYCVAQLRLTPYSIRETFDNQMAGMSRPSLRDSWLGLLVQGKAIKNNSYSYAKIDVAESDRTPILISISGSPNTKIVAANPAYVEAAISELVGKLKAGDLPANLRYRSIEEKTNYQTSFALGANFTIFNAGIGARVSNDTSDNLESAAALMRREAFAVFMGNPLNPADPTGVFNDKMTKAKFDALVSSGQISASNVPVVISEIKYGQLFYVSLNSSRSARELRLALDIMGVKATCEDGKCSCDAPVGATGGCAALDVNSVLTSSTVSMDSYGGDPSLISKALQAKDFTLMIANTVSPLAMQPIAYTYTTIGRDEQAIVTLTNTTIEKRCYMMSASYIGLRTGSLCSSAVFSSIPK